jgi:hypothetical protein
MPVSGRQSRQERLNSEMKEYTMFFLKFCRSVVVVASFLAAARGAAAEQTANASGSFSRLRAFASSREIDVTRSREGEGVY